MNRGVNPHLALMIRPVVSRTPEGCEECLRLHNRLGMPRDLADALA